MTSSVNQRWLGYLRGSRTGKLFLEELEDGSSVLTIGFDGGGDLRLDVTPNDDFKTINLTTIDTQLPFGSATIDTQTEDYIKGSWNFVTGAAGLFDLTRPAKDHEEVQQTNQADRLWNREVPLGAITLYRADLKRLIAEMESLVPSPSNTTIRATEDEHIVIEQADKYLEREDYLDVVRVMTISTAEITNAALRKLRTQHCGKSQRCL